jgi:hypothetical protein
MLLNKLPVLDNGYVALIDSVMPHKQYQAVVDEFYNATDTAALHKLCYAIIVFKAPLFVQLHLAQHGLTLVSTKIKDNEAYVPSIGEIGCSNHETNKLISEDMSRTTEALLINPSAYQADGCDAFLSQVILPISSYATFLVGGSLEIWQKFYNTKSVPMPIKSYASAVEQLIKVEWKHV